MKTLEQLAKLAEEKKFASDCIDGRDLSRLAKFIPFNLLEKFGLTPNDEYNNEEKWNATVIPFTRENILKQLKSDVDFGFEKALNKRGISSGLMFCVVKMWNWILEEGLEDWSDDNYAQYGLPLFKATALKYGFDNPIGDNEGNEFIFSAESDEYYDYE